MKAICPISGVPFRTYDSLPITIGYHHPIFSLSYHELIQLLEYVRDLEEVELVRLTEAAINQNKETYQDLETVSLAKSFSTLTIEAIHEKNYKNPTFKLYQTKQLVLLAFMRHAGLLEVERGYVARPKPKVIEAFFWQGVDLFAWVGTVSHPNILASLPHYKVSQQNQNMANFETYLDVLEEAKDGINSRYRSIQDDRKTTALAKAITLLNQRRAVYNKELTKGSNHLAAKWALLVTRPPESIVPFWYGILSSSSIKLTFEGVKIGEKWEAVTYNDLLELRDWMLDNLMEPRGEVKQTHLDDSEYYFMARKCVLDIIKRHITIIEQGTASFNIINAVYGNELQSLSDDKLELRAIEAGLPGKPDLSALAGKKIEALKAMAKWRIFTKQELIAIDATGETPKVTETKSIDKKEPNYEII